MIHVSPCHAEDVYYLQSNITRTRRKCRNTEARRKTATDTAPAIKSVQAFSSGWAEQHEEHRFGTWKPRIVWALTSRSWVKLPLNYFLSEHIEIPGAEWQPIAFQPSDDPLFEGFEGVFDVIGDGSMILLPTPGHTPGSLSMLIRREGWAPIFPAGDLTYELRLLEEDLTPGTGDRAELLKSFAKVRHLKACLPNLEIVPSHDFGASDALERATRGARQS